MSKTFVQIGSVIIISLSALLTGCTNVPTPGSRTAIGAGVGAAAGAWMADQGIIGSSTLEGAALGAAAGGGIGYGLDAANNPRR